MRIIQVCRTFEPTVGGLEHSVGGLVRALRDRGHEVRVVTLRQPGAERTALRGVEIVRLPRVGPRRYPGALGLRAAVRGADLVHVHGLDALADQLVAGAAGGAPVGISTHGGYWHTARQRTIKALWLRTGTRWTLSRADRVWFTSAADREVLAPAGRDGAILPDGIELARFAGVVRRPEPGVLLSVGRVDVHKGLDLLIDALGALAERTGERLRLEVVGPEAAPGLVGALSRRAGERGVSSQVRFLGSRTGGDLLEALGRAERVVLPSRYEGFGLAAVEAMAARVPLVLSDIPAFRAHAGFAEIVDFRDPVRAADALRAPIDSGRVERAAAHAATFGWEARVRAWEEEYRGVLEGR